MIDGPVFVTGGTGFVGSHLVERLLKSGVSDVRCLVRSSPRWLDGLPVRVIEGDLDNTRALGEALAGVETVFHIAALTRARSYDAFHAANVRGTELLLERIEAVAPAVRRVVLTSSLAAVGRSNTPVPDESAPLHPVSWYGRSKMEMEQVSRPFMDRLPITIVRPPAVFGPREADIHTFFRTMSRGLCPIVGSGRDPALSLVYVDDLVDGMLRAAAADAATGGTYFLGNRTPLSWHTIRDAAAAALGRRVITLPVPRILVRPVGVLSEFGGRLTGSYPAMNREKATEILDAATMCDSTLAMNTFDYSPDTSLQDAMNRTMTWYRENGWL